MSAKKADVLWTWGRRRRRAFSATEAAEATGIDSRIVRSYLATWAEDGAARRLRSDGVTGKRQRGPAPPLWKLVGVRRPAIWNG